jgi:DNA-binding CsgD family transcriptional regulator
MREAGARRPTWERIEAERPAPGWEALTPAESRVAELISAGHTNRVTAERLGVSANTVGTQLRSVFDKLGVTSRVQLANLRRRPPAPAAH